MLSGVGGLEKDGSGTLFYAERTLTARVDNDQCRNIAEVSGTLSDSTDVINSGTYDVDASDTIQSLSGSGGVDLGSGVVLTTGDSGDDTISGVISGAGGLKKMEAEH